MASKLITSNLKLLIYILFFNSLFFLVSSEKNEQKNIFDESYLKHLKLKNRIFRGSVGDTSFKDGKLTEEGFKLYDQFSKNEVGTIFTGYTAVSDYNQFDNVHMFRLDKDEYIPEYKKLVNLVHKNGANIIMQLVHIGMNTFTKADPVYAPSPLPIKNQNRFTKEMTKEDIIRIENDFAEAALRAKKAGFDGIEIHGAHFYLISEFLSPLTNKRKDVYGGNDENRARFLLEIIDKVREKVGKDYIVGLKINSEDCDENGITKESFIKTCLMAEKAGVDYIQVSGMTWLRGKTKRPLYSEIGAELADKIKIPVIIIGGIRTIEEANEILNKSHIQYIGIARPLICEFDLIKKWKEGVTKKSRCVSCNSCIFKDFGYCVFNKNKCDMISAQPASFQSIQLGEYKITYLPDGEGYTIPSLSYHGSTEDDWKKLKKYLNKEGKSLKSIGSFLIEYKKEKILFDLGIGPNPFSIPEGNFNGGELLKNLKKAGLDRKDITKIIYSHFHPDHIGWTTMEENGKRVLTFPNANYYSSKNEWEFWVNKNGDTFGIDLNNFKEPLEGKIHFLEDREEILPNLFVKFEFGHTPGLINLILNTDGKRIWFISDLVHSDLQFENLNWCYFTDNNEERAIKTRINVLEDLSKPNTIIANSNFIGEAFGYLKKEEKGKYKFGGYTK